jgi:diguanylate cyclase (GGDEF)-like protein
MDPRGLKPPPTTGDRLEQPVEVIIVNPLETDLAMIESVLAGPAFKLTSVVTAPDSAVAAWFASRGAERFDDVAGVSRLLPGALLVHCGEGLPPADVMERAAAHGLSVINRDAFSRYAREAASAPHGPLTTEVVRRYRRLLEDYFPTSRNSSTAVKLASCLTEATSLWHAAGGVILTGTEGVNALAVTAQRGVDLQRDATIKIEPGTFLDRCINRGKHEALTDLSSEEGELLPGVKAGSALCMAIKSGTSTRGALLLWCDLPDAVSAEDIPPLTLFAYYIALLLDVDDLGDRLGENLVTDPLTGLHNRRQFDHRLHQELLRARRYTLNMSLVVMDIDNLEEYNAACGHMLGNLALSDISSILLKGTREVDLVSRIGGDEFGLILPETNRLGALRLTDRLRSEVAGYPFPAPENSTSVNLTVSAGIANFPSSSGSDEELLAKAFRALDLARKEGQDSIKLWDDKLEDAE